MNWKKRKIITVITVLVTMGALYATVGRRHYNHNNYGCHSHQSEHCQGDAEKAETPNSDQVVDEE